MLAVHCLNIILYIFSNFSLLSFFFITTLLISSSYIRVSVCVALSGRSAGYLMFFFLWFSMTYLIAPPYFSLHNQLESLWSFQIGLMNQHQRHYCPVHQSVLFFLYNCLY